LLRAWEQAPRDLFLRGVVVGALAHVIVVVVAYVLTT
jgi:hypothetical protein